MPEVKPHPYTSATHGAYCDWCQLPRANRVHNPEPTQWQDAYHSLTTGWVMMALAQASSPDQIVTKAEPLYDNQGNYSDTVRIFTSGGRVYHVTITPEDD